MKKENPNKKIVLSYADLVCPMIASEAQNGNHSIVTIEDMLFFKYLLAFHLTKFSGGEPLSIACSINTKIKDGENSREIFKKYPCLNNIGVWDVFMPQDFVKLTNPSLEAKRLAKIKATQERLVNLSLYKGCYYGAEVYSTQMLKNEALLSIALDEDYYSPQQSNLKLNAEQVADMKSFELGKFWFDKSLKDSKSWADGHLLSVNLLANHINAQNEQISFLGAKKAIEKSLMEYKNFNINKINKGFVAGLTGNAPREDNMFYISGYSLGQGGMLEVEPTKN